jgi:hypothetical protein
MHLNLTSPSVTEGVIFVFTETKRNSKINTDIKKENIFSDETYAQHYCLHGIPTACASLYLRSEIAQHLNRSPPIPIPVGKTEIVVKNPYASS